jgi:hypothetical protein
VERQGDQSSEKAHGVRWFSSREKNRKNVSVILSEVEVGFATGTQSKDL